MRSAIRRSWARVKGVYDDYPKPFWTLTFATFIDAVGGALTFLLLYRQMKAKPTLGMQAKAVQGLD